MAFSKRLAEARRQSGLSQAELASAIGAGQSTVATWERGKNEPDLSTIEKIARTLERPREWLAFGLLDDLGSELSLISEVDVRAPSGAQGLIEVTQRGSAEATLRRYGFPKSEIRALFGTAAENIVILEVIGDSMIPTLHPGEKVIVNTQDTIASPPGIFVLWDGMGLVLKRVEFVAHSDPPRLRVSSDNPRYQSYDRLADEAFIQGRVVGHWSRR